MDPSFYKRFDTQLEELRQQGLFKCGFPVQFSGAEPQTLQLVRSALYSDRRTKPRALLEDEHD